MKLPLPLRKKYKFVRHLSYDVEKYQFVGLDKYVVVRKVGHFMLNKKWYQEEKILNILKEEKNNFFPILLDVHDSKKEKFIICEYIDGVIAEPFIPILNRI